MNRFQKVSAVLLGSGAILLSSPLIAAEQAPELPPVFTQGARIVFQGDSITDMAHHPGADQNHILGHSYVFLIAARMGAHYPGQKLKFINSGVSGNRVQDLAARWQRDTLMQKPDILSVLVGVNDICKESAAHKRVNAAEFEQTYDRILGQAMAANPRLKIVLCEPFIEPGRYNQGHWNEWQEDVRNLQAAVARLGRKYNAPVVPLQRVFDEACKRDGVGYWVWDGVHPTYSGQELIAEEWLKAVREAWPAPLEKGAPVGQPVTVPKS